MWGKEKYVGKVGATCGCGDGAMPRASPAPTATELKGRAVLFPPSRPRELAGLIRTGTIHL